MLIRGREATRSYLIAGYSMSGICNVFETIILNDWSVTFLDDFNLLVRI